VREVRDMRIYPYGDCMVSKFYEEFDYKMLKEISEEKQILLKEYFKYMTLKKITDMNRRGVNVGDKSFMGCEIESNDESDIVYVFKSLTENDEDRVKSEELEAYMKDSPDIFLLECTNSEVLSELRYVCYVSIIKGSTEYIETHEKFLIESIENERERQGVILDESKMCKKFREMMLILPNSLQKYYKNYLETNYKRDLSNILFKEVGMKKPIDTSIFIVSQGLDFINNYKEDNGLTKERVARLIKDIHDVYDFASGGRSVNVEIYMNASSQFAYYVDAKNGERMATVNEAKFMVDSIKRKEIKHISDENASHLSLFVWAISGKKTMLRKYNKLVRLDSNIFIDNPNICDEIYESLVYMATTFKNEDLVKLKQGLKPIKYLKNAEDEIKNQGLENKLKIVMDICKGSGNSYYIKAYDIAYKALKYGRVLSEKQIKIINSIYENFNNPDNDNNKYNTELAKLIDEIEVHFSNSGMRDTFVFKLISSVRDRKLCSVKQYNIIIEYRDKMREEQREHRDITPMEIESERVEYNPYNVDAIQIDYDIFGS